MLAELRQILTDWASRIVRFTTIKSAKSDGSATLAGRQIPGKPQPAASPTRLLAPFGFRSVPPPGLDAAEIRAQGSIRGSMTAPCDTAQYGPDNVATDGSEAVVYNKDNARALAATGPDVVVNEGTLEVARRTDPTGSGTVSVALHTVSGAPTAFFFWTPQGSTPACAFPPNAAPVPTLPTVLWFAMLAGVPVIALDTLVNMALPGKITAGAPHFKGQ